MKKVSLMVWGVVCVGMVLYAVRIFAQEQDEQGAGEESAEVGEGEAIADIPSEYQWIFGETVLPSVDEALQQEEEEWNAKKKGAKGKVVPKLEQEMIPAVDKVADPEPYTHGHTVDPLTWHFGEVKHGRVLEHEFVVKNTSKRKMQITSVNTSCGCTVSEVAKKELLPGEETPVSVRFKTRGYSGNVKQSIFVHTDDPAQPVIRYIVKAKIVRLAE